MLTLSIIKLFELSWNISMVLNVAIGSIYRVHILVVSDRYLSHQWIVVTSAISWRCIISRLLYFLLFRTAMLFRWTYVLWFGRLSHPYDFVLLKLISIIFISWFRLAMYAIKTVVLFSWWTFHWGFLYLSGGPLLILCSRLLAHNGILSTFTLDAQRLIFKLSHDRLLLTLDDWSHLLIWLLLWYILGGQLFWSQLN